MKMSLKNKISLAIILVINIISIVVLALFANHELSNVHYEQKKLETIILKNVQRKLDSVIDTNLKFANMIAFSEEAENFVKNEKTDYYNVKKLSDIIINYASFSKSRIIAFSDKKDLYVDGNGTYHEQDIEKYFGDIPYDVMHLKEQNGGICNLLQTDGLKDNICAFICKCSTRKNRDLYFLISINSDELKNTFSADEGELFLLDGENVIFGDKELYGRLKNRKASEVSSGMVYNWKYVYIPEKSSDALIYLKYLLILSVLCAFSVFFGTKLSISIYNPIGNILKRFSDDDNVDNEMEYINRKITEMRDSNIKLEQGMARYKKIAQKQYLKNIIFALEDGSSNMEYSRMASKYKLAVIECRNSEITEEICEYIESLIFCETVSISSSTIAVIVYGDNIDFENRFRIILIGIEQKYGKICCGAISSEAVCELKDISKLYPGVDRALRNSAVFTNEIMIASGSVPDDGYYYPVDTEKIIIDYIKNGDFDKALSAINSVLQKNLFEMDLPHDVMTDFKLAMVSTIKRTLSLLEKSEAELFGDDYIMYIELGASHSLEGMRDKVISIFETIFNSCENNKDETSNYLADKILKYVNESFCNPDLVCLTGISERFNVSTAYISRIFKRYTGVNYKDYIISLRIEQAKKLLRENDVMKVKDVSEAVGYTNVNSFIRMFEKREGFSPEIYKKRKR